MSSNTLDAGGEAFGAGWTRFSVGLLLGAIILGLAGFTLLKTLADTDEPQLSSPNILLLVADDLGYNDVGAFGNGNAKTPNIDALADQGVSFTRHYADTTCSPSRVALLTGMFPQRMGFRHNGVIIPEEYRTIAEVLNSNGYDTAAVGKWHAGSQYQEGWPLQKGFDEWFGFLTQFQLADIVPHDSKLRLTPTYLDPVLRLGNEPPQKFQGHLTDLLLKKSLEFLEQRSGTDKPWFLYHAFFAPHTPIQPAARFAKLFEQSGKGRYQALVYQMDDAIGQLTQALKNSGQYDNTIIIFLSDNGGTNKELNNNAPFYGAKAEFYEGSFRTPMIISWPDKIESGGTMNSIAMNVDVLPTVAELIGLNPDKATDGYSYARQLLGLASDADVPKRSRLWEEYVWRMDANSYSFLDGEKNQRFSGLWGVSNHWADLNVDDTGAASLSSDVGEIYTAVATRYWRAHNDMSILVADDLRDNAATWEFSKFDWMRTPGLNGFTLGLGIGPLIEETQFESQLPMTIARQEGVWQLVLEKEHTLVWEIGGQSITSKQLDLQHCNEIVLSSHTVSETTSAVKGQQNTRQRTGSIAKIFVNNRLSASSEYSEPKLEISQIRQPTRVFAKDVLAREKVYIRNTPATAATENPAVYTDNEVLRQGLESYRREGMLFYQNVSLAQHQLCN